MKLEHRLQSLELKFVIKKPGCNGTFYIVMPEGMKNKHFDADSYRPSTEEIEKYLKQLKDTSQCRGCKGSCAIDWSPEGFMNHTIAGEGRASALEPKISWMFCANAETPMLCRRLMNKDENRYRTIPNNLSQ